MRSLLATGSRAVTFDEWLARGAGVAVVRSPKGGEHAVLALAARRLRAGGREVLMLGGGSRVVPLFHEVALRLGHARVAADPAACAAQIAGAAAIVCPAPPHGSWDHAVVLELAKLDAVTIVLVGDHEVPGAAFHVDIAGPDTESVPPLDLWLEGAGDEGLAARLVGSDDPWALLRGAELLVDRGDHATADEAIARALRTAGDPRIAAEIGARWEKKVELVPEGDAGFELRTSAAKRALERGEASEAQRWCERARRERPSDPGLLLLLARSLVQLGDLVAARVCLAQAESHAGDDDTRARVHAERADAALLGGDHASAAAEAARALALTSLPATRLAARGTLGKLLLARGAWDLADAHFAEDALAASAANESAAELRARLNRAIALLSAGQLSDARALLEDVLERGAELEEERARAYALSNLGLVAYRQRDYAGALTYWERAMRLPQALRGRLATALTIGNVAEVRLRLGQVDHAEHAIAFGRRLLGANVPARVEALFRWVGAKVALARGDTASARREIDAAIVAAETSAEHDYLESAFLVATRISLADGDLGRAGRDLERAGAIAKSASARAEVALLRALLARARGRSSAGATSFERLVDEAEALARSSGDQDLVLESGHLAARARVAVPPRAPSIGEPSELVGDDPQIRSLEAAIRKVAGSTGTVLIRGESGTGKELVATALHRKSPRRERPLVSINCAALVEDLLLSELFGHEKGAFTGAAGRRRGRFELAEGGTLFLDEIGDISPRTQVALLRVLQERTFERVGGAAPLKVDVRVICATHRDLRAMVERGEFREDLYYRLCGITLDVPPLRARVGDLPKLADHLLRRIARERGANEPPKTLTPDALDLLAAHRWPGNVRELENALRAAALFAEGPQIDARDLRTNVDELGRVRPARDTEHPQSSEEPPRRESALDGAWYEIRSGAVSLSELKRRIERDCIERALAESAGNITRAAALLGMKRPRLSQLVKQYGLEPVVLRATSKPQGSKS